MWPDILPNSLENAYGTFTGKTFNKKYTGVQFVKLTNIDENHNGYQFKDGLNVDTIPFSTQRDCSPGGIYFCRIDNFVKYLKYGTKTMHFIRFVTIPDDAKVFQEHDKYKSDKIILSERYNIFENEKICLEAVKQNSGVLKYIEHQTPEMCLIAVQKDGHALQYVKEQTHDLCLIAIRQNSGALEYVKDQTSELCLIAVRKNGYNLEFVKNQTPEICLAAVKQKGCALQYVKDQDQTHDLCLIAVQQNSAALLYVAPGIILTEIRPRPNT